MTIGHGDTDGDRRVDWDGLERSAIEVARNGYAPYSHLQVGAAGLVEDGRTVVGCNVENASYGISLCAECGMISALVASGGGKLLAVCTVGGTDGSFGHLTPCGRCRQLLMEHGGPGLLVAGDAAPQTLGELLPGAFTAIDLPS